ncbi:(deoxy)nucleoside triphosphate pyrophosphohydrolase [Psychromicrobium lacuslunae]|uniref:8-oxo-dGTP diphosphatase n=1 Tax=Psychromicrobium lacuslunae TaxID=1618207 RepID=A0A0D4BWX1_9MICC|nr:(deoxy)nucleoside triphosphate pyrophosphohydrolase [Psychromicrobium lacuslunae]AJT40610.1 DNA mismatch repair protein MutT [Psychromicrobium lacuslunae]
MPKLIVGAAILDDLRHPSKLLVARRSAPASLAGLWEFPGGKVEPGEKPEQAVHRELAEELGVRVVLGDELAAADPAGWPLLGNAVMRVWFTALQDGVPRPLEDHSELRWMPLTEGVALLELPWIPADLPIVAELLRVLGFESEN